MPKNEFMETPPKKLLIANGGNNLPLRNLAPNIIGPFHGHFGERIPSRIYLKWLKCRTVARQEAHIYPSLSESARNAWMNFPIPQPIAEFHWENPRTHIGWALVFPIHFLWGP
jgi:hypothetical protein